MLARGFPVRFQFLASLLVLLAAQEARAFILEFNVPEQRNDIHLC